MKIQYYLLHHLTKQSRSFASLHNLQPNKVHVSSYHTKCQLQPVYISRYTPGCPVSIHSHFFKAYITVKVSSNDLLGRSVWTFRENE